LKAVGRVLGKRISAESIVENEEDAVNSMGLLFQISKFLPDFSVSNILQLSDASWMRVVKSEFYRVYAEPYLFVHLITEIHNAELCAELLKKFTVQVWEADESFKKNAETFLSTNVTALGHVVEVVSTRRVISDVMDLTLSVFTKFCESNEDSGASLLHQNYAPARTLRMIKAFKVGSKRVGRATADIDGFESWEPFQTAGLLRMCGEVSLGNELFLSCLNCIQTMKISRLLEDPVIVLGILRHLVRSFETRNVPVKLLSDCAKKTGPKLVKMLRQRAKAEQSTLKSDDFTVTGGIAALVILILDFMKSFPSQLAWKY